MFLVWWFAEIVKLLCWNCWNQIGITRPIVLKYSGHARWFWKHKNVNATYLLFILEGIKIDGALTRPFVWKFLLNSKWRKLHNPVSFNVFCFSFFFIFYPYTFCWLWLLLASRSLVMHYCCFWKFLSKKYLETNLNFRCQRV